MLENEPSWETESLDSHIFPSQLFPKIGQQTLQPIRRVEKYYVLNRIASAETTKRIIELLKEFGVKEERILEVRFDWDEYARIRPRWEGVEEDSKRQVWGFGSPVGQDGGVGEGGEEWKKGLERLKMLDWTLGEKNLYGINNVSLSFHPMIYL
jgi:hypothetical protein